MEKSVPESQDLARESSEERVARFVRALTGPDTKEVPLTSQPLESPKTTKEPFRRADKLSPGD